MKKTIKKMNAKTDFVQLLGVGLLIAGYVTLVINSLPQTRLPLIILFLGWFCVNKIKITISSDINEKNN